MTTPDKTAEQWLEEFIAAKHRIIGGVESAHMCIVKMDDKHSWERTLLAEELASLRTELGEANVDIRDAIEADIAARVADINEREGSPTYVPLDHTPIDHAEQIAELLRDVERHVENLPCNVKVRTVLSLAVEGLRAQVEAVA